VKVVHILLLVKEPLDSSNASNSSPFFSSSSSASTGKSGKETSPLLILSKLLFRRFSGNGDVQVTISVETLVNIQVIKK